MSALDHERIREEQDRSFTLPLVDIVLNTPAPSPEWSEAARTLAHLEDHRVVVPLTRYIEDRERPVESRQEIARILDGFDLTTTSTQRRRWWASGDDVLAEHALRLMERADAEIVAAVAADGAHPLRAVAMGTLEWGFEEPEFQALKVDGLRSRNADVCIAAAYSASWDEPLAAEGPLRELLANDDPGVVRVAAYALQYFPSMATLDALRALDADRSGDVETQRAESETSVRWDIESELNRCNARAHAMLRRWCDAIELEPEAPNGPNASPPPPNAQPSRLDPSADAASFDEALDTTTGSMLTKARALRSIDWAAVAQSERPALAQRLAEHADPEVRNIATSAFSAWSSSQALIDLLDDRHALVRKSAMYALGSVPPDPRIAAIARSHLDDVSGTAAGEALTAFAHHADATDRAEVLFDLAVTDRRVSIRARAVQLLAEAGESRRLSRLVRLLDDAPEVNWSFHLALLATDEGRGAEPDLLRDLAEVDNIHIAAAAARVLSSAP